MTNRFKYIKHLSWFLFVAFILPQTVQNYHVLTVHHHKTHCTAKHEKHFHIANNDCPIDEYVFATSHKIEFPLQISRVEIQFNKQIIAKVISLKSINYHSYYLRGPPSEKQTYSLV